MVEFLLDRGASVEGGDDESETSPLAWARMRGHEEIASILVARGAREQVQGARPTAGGKTFAT